jgi:hypothetical protein
MSGIQISVFPSGSTITDAYNISTNGTGAFGDNSNNLLINFTPSKDSAQLGVKGNINSVGTYFSNSVTSIRLPADSTANRPPQGLRGYIRYNTDLSQNNIEYYNGSVPAWQQLMTTTYYQSVVSVSPPTQKSYTSLGTTTYTPTSSSVLYIKIRMVGGGGGGAGGGSGGNGSNGTDSTFGSSLFTAKGGIGGTSNGNFTVSASPGGIITGSGIIIKGGQGGGCRTNNTPLTTPPSTQPGGPGGSSYFGGNGGGAGGIGNLSGGAGVAGGGGGGGGTTVLGFTLQGAGGSAGGYIEVYLSSPASFYSITVGTGGTAGTAGVAGSGGGGRGGDGVIIIDEYYH